MNHENQPIKSNRSPKRGALAKEPPPARDRAKDPSRGKRTAPAEENGSESYYLTRG